MTKSIKLFHIETKRVFKYIILGSLTTFLTWVLWNLLLILTKSVDFPFDQKFSITQYVASFLMILPSFWLHRHFTFKDKNHRSKSISQNTLKAYLVYILSPLIASLCTFLVLQFFPLITDFSLSLTEIFSLPLGKWGLQFAGLLVGFVCNYLGQRLWIYEK